MLGKQKIRFIRAWQTYRVGDVIQPPAVRRDWLIGNGYAEPVSGETAAVPPLAVSRASRPPQKGQRRF